MGTGKIVEKKVHSLTELNNIVFFCSFYTTENEELLRRIEAFSSKVINDEKLKHPENGYVRFV